MTERAQKETKKKKRIRHFRELVVYRRGFEGAMRIFQFTKGFPIEERYSLVDQVRRCSRSVCSNLAEGWRKRRDSAFTPGKTWAAWERAAP